MSDKDPIHIGALAHSSPSMVEQIPICYHKYLLLFDPEHAGKSPDSQGCDHNIESTTSQHRLRMGPIYQLSQEEEKIFVQCLEKMIKEKKIRHSSYSVRSPILFVP